MNSATLKTESFPVWAISPLVNGDASGTTAEEDAMIAAWEKKNRDLADVLFPNFSHLSYAFDGTEIETTAPGFRGEFAKCETVTVRVFFREPARSAEQVRADQRAAIIMAANPATGEERPETYAEYLIRLAADCRESGNTGHAEDHDASAGAIRRLSKAIELQLEAYQPKEEGAEMSFEAMDIAAEIARHALDSVSTTENALAAAGFD